MSLSPQFVLGGATCRFTLQPQLKKRGRARQLAILELDQSTSTQVINMTISVLLFAGLIHFPRNSRYVRRRKLFRWSAGPCFSVTRLLGVLRERLSHIAGQEQGCFRKTFQSIDSIEHGLLFGLFLALQQTSCDES